MSDSSGSIRYVRLRVLQIFAIFFIDLLAAVVTSPTASASRARFSNLLNKSFKPQTDSARQEVQTAVRTLAEHALAGTKLISNDVVATIESLVAEIDRRLAHEVRTTLHEERRANLYPGQPGKVIDQCERLLGGRQVERHDDISQAQSKRPRCVRGLQ